MGPDTYRVGRNTLTWDVLFMCDVRGGNRQFQPVVSTYSTKNHDTSYSHKQPSLFEAYTFYQIFRILSTVATCFPHLPQMLRASILEGQECPRILGLYAEARKQQEVPLGLGVHKEPPWGLPSDRRVSCFSGNWDSLGRTGSWYAV